MKKDLPFFWKKYRKLDLGGGHLSSFTYFLQVQGGYGAESQIL
jgi:hypothetical protein